MAMLQLLVGFKKWNRLNIVQQSVKSRLRSVMIDGSEHHGTCVYEVSLA